MHLFCINIEENIKVIKNDAAGCEQICHISLVTLGKVYIFRKQKNIKGGQMYGVTDFKE